MFADYILHLPIIQERLPYLQTVDKLLVVGSPIRAEKLAVYLREKGHVCHEYCHIVSGNTDREYSLYSCPDLGVAIASHGIGSSGVEICLTEVSALIAMAKNDTESASPLKAVIRSGTRGTIADVPLGTIALSTSTQDDDGNTAKPNTDLYATLKATAMRMAPEGLVHEGHCLSAEFFWSGQGRYAYPLRHMGDTDDAFLRDLKSRQNVAWIEMEDHYLNHFASKYGIASASLGLVIARRYNPANDKFELSYDANMKKQAELLPVEIALETLLAFGK